MAGTGAGTGPHRVLVGAIAGAHGVRGLVKVRSYTAEPADIAAYGPLTDADGGRRLEIEVLSAASGGGGALICRIPGVADRNAAEALKGLRLYAERSAFPEAAEDEFYQADLIGLPVELPDGSAFGRVVAVQNYGAGDILEIERPGAGPGGRGRTVDLPFTRAAVPVIDLAAGRVVVDPPAGLLEPEAPEREEPERESSEPGAARPRRARSTARGGERT